MYLKSQIATSNYEGHGGRRKLPYVFTEHGIMMLAGMLKSEIAVEISKKIINAFIAMRHFIKENKEEDIVEESVATESISND